MAIDLTTFIAIYGALVSTGLLFWKVYVYYSENTSKLKVEVGKTLMVTTTGISENQISINISNIGKKPVTVDSGKFVTRKDLNDFGVLTLSLPKKIEEGQSHSVYVIIEGIKGLLKQQVPEIIEYVELTDQTGKKYKSKKLSKSVYELLK